MKILLSNKFFYPRGGDCIHTIGLKNLLEQHGHEVAIYSMQHPDNLLVPESKFWPSEVSFGSKKPMGLIKAFVRPFGANEVKNSFTTMLRKFDPDIVHLHNIHSQLSPTLAQIAKKHGKPVVWTLHDYKLVCPAYTLLDNDGKICQECFQNPKAVLKKNCIKGSKLGSALGYFESKKWNSQKLNSYTDKFIAPSSFMKGKMVEGGFPDHKIEHIYNFAENSKFTTEPATIRENKFIYLGRLSREKGVETLCKAFSGLKVKTNLHIIGDGPLRSKLEKEYASESIHFEGFLGWDSIKFHLANASALIIPSEWHENNPLTVIESLGLGTPVIGAKIGGIPELIKNNENGFLFESQNIEELKEQINNVLEKKDWDHTQISINAQKMFSPDSFIKKLTKLYTEINV